MLDEYIFGELTFDKFKELYLDKKPVLIKKANDLFKSLNVSTVDELLNSNEGNIHSFTRVLENNVDIEIPTNPLFFYETQKKFISKSYLNGATIKVEDFEVRNKLMSDICRTFESVLGGDTYAMTFLTPPNQKGFGIHFDPVSSIIVQLSGSKHWKVYAEMVSFPTLEMNRPIPREELGDPVIEADVEPGDLLYIPPGYPHEADCTDLHSLHMTIGLMAHRPVDILQFAIKELLESNIELRKPIYPKNKDEFYISVNEAKDILINKIKDFNIKKSIDKFETAHNTNKIDSNFLSLLNVTKADNLSLSTKVKCVENKKTKIIYNDEEIVLYPSSTIRYGRPLLIEPPYITLPISAREEIDMLLNCDSPVAIRDLPGKLDDPSKIILARELCYSGLIEIFE